MSVVPVQVATSGGGNVQFAAPPVAGRLLTIFTVSRTGPPGVPAGWTLRGTCHAANEFGSPGGDASLGSKISDGTETGPITGQCMIEWPDGATLGQVVDASEQPVTGFTTHDGDISIGPVTPDQEGSTIVGCGSLGLFEGGGGAWEFHATPDVGVTEVCDVRPAGGPPSAWVAYRTDVDDAATVDGTVTGPTPPSIYMRWGWIAYVVNGVAVPPEPGVELPVYDPDDVFLGDLTEAFDIQIRVELNGTGSGRFSINRHSTEATAALLKPGNYVRVTIPQIDSDPIFGFFLEQGDFKLVSSDEEGGETINFGGRGGLAYWDRAIWLAQSFLLQWWPGYMSTPPAGAIGAIALLSGTYIDYGVLSGAVVSENPFSTGGFSAYYDSIRTFRRTDGVSGTDSPITLVHLVTSAHANDWIHSSGAGIKRYPNKGAYVLGDSVLMKDIGTGTKPGEVLHSMYQEAVDAARPEHPIPGMTIDFDATNDSASNPWTETDALAAVSAQLNDDYLSTIVKLVDTGVIDVVMGPDLDMHAYNAYGRDLHGAFGSGTVRFQKGVNIADELLREYSDQPIGTFAQIVGNVEGAIAFATLASPYAPREIGVSGESSDTDALEALGLAELEARLLHSDAIGFAVATPIIGAEDPDNGLYLPGPPGSIRGNYWIGDLATLHTGTGEHDFNATTIRIAAITMSFTGSNDLAVVVEMNSSFGGRTASEMGARGGSPSTGTTGGVSGTLSDLYQLLSEKDQPEGYPSLDGNGRVDFRELETSWKLSVRTASLANLTLATGFEPGDTVGGVVLVEGDDILVAGQTDASENGIRTVQASGEPARRLDMSTGTDVLGAAVLVREGDSAGKVFYATTTTAPVIDTNDIEFAELTSAAMAALDDLTDVVITSPATADRLRFDGSVWRNSSLKWKPVLALDPTSGLYVNVHSGGDPVMAEG